MDWSNDKTGSLKDEWEDTAPLLKLINNVQPNKRCLNNKWGALRSHINLRQPAMLKYKPKVEQDARQILTPAPDPHYYVDRPFMRKTVIVISLCMKCDIVSRILHDLAKVQ